MFLKGRSEMSIEQLKQGLFSSYHSLLNEVPNINLSEKDFRKLMFSLWIADASTLSIVNKKRRDFYIPLYQKIDTLDFDSLEKIVDLRVSIEQQHKEYLIA